MDPKGWPDRSLPGDRPQEKGIDVALALDFVMMAYCDEYDVGVLMSTDTDLKPALEYAVALGDRRVEVAAWTGGVSARRLDIEARKLWCHWLKKSAYAQVADPTKYAGGF